MKILNQKKSFVCDVERDRAIGELVPTRRQGCASDAATSFGLLRSQELVSNSETLRKRPADLSQLSFERRRSGRIVRSKGEMPLDDRNALTFLRSGQPCAQFCRLLPRHNSP